MGKKWRSAVLGAGMVAQWHARVLGSLDCAELVAVCARDRKKARATLDSAGVGEMEIFTDLNALLSDGRFDVLHICTPSGAHLEPAIAAMQAKRHVICEKPLEIRLDRIDRMIQCASENNVRLAGVFQNRWSESSRALKSAMDEGRFGAVSFAGCYTQWYRTNQYYQEGGWHGTWQLDGGGAAMNQAVHAIDLLQWIAGPVKTVSAYSAKRAHPKIEVEDTLACSLELNSGALGCIVATTAMYPGSAARLEIGGEKGTAVLEGYLKTFSFQDARAEDAALLASVKPKIESSAGGANPADVRLELHAANFTSIFNAWEAGRDAETNGTEARKAVAIVLAMYDSARNGGAPVSVDWR